MSPVLRTLIFTVVVPGFWTIAFPYFLLPRGTRPDLRGIGLLGLPLIAAGIALYLACAFWGFAIRGRGTPAPFDPPRKLVSEGPYRFVRNPMYWGVFSVVLGEAAMFHSRVLLELALGFLVATSLFVLLYEEPVLRRKFGAEYEEYCRRVPRWFPRL
jgi:protein-S-isoprenylcysteine O-methyltransferase Ste14